MLFDPLKIHYQDKSIVYTYQETDDSRTSVNCQYKVFHCDYITSLTGLFQCGDVFTILTKNAPFKPEYNIEIRPVYEDK